MASNGPTSEAAMPASDLCWTCDFCIVERFDTYEEAVAHEQTCGLPPPPPVAVPVGGGTIGLGGITSSTSTSTDTDMVKCIHAREEAFRCSFHENDVSPRRTLPQEANNEIFGGKPIRITVPQLSRVSSQISPQRLSAFLRHCPLGDAMRTYREGRPVPRVRIIHPESRHYEGSPNVSQDYDAMADAALMLRDIDAATSKADNKAVFNPSGQTKNVEEEGTTQNMLRDGTTQGRVPPLLTFAKKATQEVVMPEMLVLEKSFVEILSKARKQAEESFDDVVEKTEHQLKELVTSSPEITEVQRLRRLLDRAEKKLYAKASAIERTAINKRDNIQKEYDQYRASVAMEYTQKRSKKESEFVSCSGFFLCQRCLCPFHPQQRACLPGHKRCSVAGCNSAERFCLDCCSAPCLDCYQPLCSAHEIPHEVECTSHRPRICGYDVKMRNMDKGTKHGCCGKAGSQTRQCSSCKVNVCNNCGSEQPHSERYLCPKCDALGRNLEHPPVRIKWGGPEYRERRTRYLTKSYEEDRAKGRTRRCGAYWSFTGKTMDLIPPVDVVKRGINLFELKKVQRRTRLGKRRYREMVDDQESFDKEAQLRAKQLCEHVDAPTMKHGLAP